ncbi:nitroreductase family protein [Agrobacterium sp. AGB01]|uniref:nitroreductase family protein n=1 Tax=Agrobacterium sp. AGB01 TaxID=2769302 RepID=UPI00177E9B02|nr:nitroreductase family protein [Agrobacterium sp. AGB01]MBD9388221.1 nitroreductase family protein [Agrobacterium sp. AGB01]
MDISARSYVKRPRLIVKKISSFLRRFTGVPTKSEKLKTFHEAKQERLSTCEALAFMRHDAHRIEKAFYNNIFDAKREFYEKRRENVFKAIQLALENGVSEHEPTLVWAREIASEFEKLPETFIKKNSISAREIDIASSDGLLKLMSTRRSSRVWSSEQPSNEELMKFALKMVEAGKWAPTSGDRQPVRFKILLDLEEKIVLKGLKEEHCYNAPCLIFIGTDRRFYGGLGNNEAAMHVDTGAAAMQMALLAHGANFGVCWNHFSTDLIQSRSSNVEVYRNFVKMHSIPDHIEPVALLAFGRAAFYPPAPARMNTSDYLL